MAGQKTARDAVAEMVGTADSMAVHTDVEACMKCHEDEVASFRNTTHSHKWKNGMACEQCHGDAAKHLETGGAPGTIQTMKDRSPNEVSSTCIKCHERTGEQGQSKMSEHYRAGVGCTNCHSLHPTDEHKKEMAAVGKSPMMKAKQSELCLSCHNAQSADFTKPTHHRLKEGVMECTNCHNPHGTNQPHQLRADTKTLCVNCHQDKRGPYAFEHNAQALDGCMACHDSHGSASRHMLKARDPRTLCLSCHSRENAIYRGAGAGVPHSRAGNSLQTTGDCTRCHASIHGSNYSEYFIQ
jgi:DmsE family decaheme c-type cytochrome